MSRIGRQDDGRYPPGVDDDSIEHVLRLPDAFESGVSGARMRKSPFRRHLRFTYEPGDLSEIAVERVSAWGHPQRDPGNRVMLLDSESIVWLHAKLGLIVKEIEAAREGDPVLGEVRISESKSAG